MTATMTALSARLAGRPACAAPRAPARPPVPCLTKPAPAPSALFAPCPQRARRPAPPSAASNSPHPFHGGGGESDDDRDSDAGEDGAASTSGSEAPEGPSHAAARRALSGAAGWDASQRPIGAEYGEGFTHYRPTGSEVQLDVDTLNERLQPSGAARHRLTLAPDEAHGAIFILEGVVSAEFEAAAGRAWAAVAAEAGFPPPPSIEDRPALLAVRPERAITDILGWTRDWGTARALAGDVAAAYVREVGGLRRPRPGIARWWGALAAARIPLAVVSDLDRATVEGMLGRMGLVGPAPASSPAPPSSSRPSPPPLLTSMAIVAAEDGAETRAQALLAAALKLGRPPAACVAFAGCPATVAAAHNASMAAVGVASPRHPAWTLAGADLQVGRFDDLTVQNVRRLFAARGAGFMDLAKERVAKGGGGLLLCPRLETQGERMAFPTRLAVRAMATHAASSSPTLGRLTPSTSTLLICDVQERFRPLIHAFPAVADTASRLVRGAAALGVPVLVTEQYPKALGPTVAEVALHLPPGTPPPAAKTDFSMWPSIQAALTARGGPAAAPHLVLTGIEAHVCVLQTTLDALAAGYEVHLVADGVSSQRPGDRATGLARCLGVGAHAATSEMVLFQWAGGAGHPAFKAVSALAKEERPQPQLPGVGESVARL